MEALSNYESLFFSEGVSPSSHQLWRVASVPQEACASHGVEYEIGRTRGGGGTWRDIHILQRMGDESSSHRDELMCGNLLKKDGSHPFPLTGVRAALAFLVMDVYWLNT